MAPDLSTTNTLIGIIAAVSVLEALVLIGAGIAGFVMYRRVMEVVNGLEVRQIAPLRAKVDDILVDVKTVTDRVAQQTARVDHAIHGTIDRVDETAERVKDSVRDKVNQATGIVRGVRAVIASILSGDGRRQPPAAADSQL
jgi:hypothetical protein